MFIDSVATDAPWAQLEAVVFAWSEAPHQPALSEHTLFCLRRDEGVVLVDADCSAILTVVPAREPGHHLVELAGPPGVDLASAWRNLRDEVYTIATIRGQSMLSVFASTSGLAFQLQRDGLRRSRSVLRGSLLPVGWKRAGVDRSGQPVQGFRAVVDRGRLLELIRITLAGHPENGDWRDEDLEERFAEPWFEESGVFLSGGPGAPNGFAWTKVHPDGVGEIYMIGVHPDHVRNGSGRALLERGLMHLVEGRQCHQVIVYWDEANRRASRLYDSAGFRVDRVRDVYSVEPGSAE